MSELQVILRETLVSGFGKPEDRETLQRFGSLILSWAIADEYSLEESDSIVGSELLAAAADLRHLAHYLGQVIEKVEGSDADLAQAHLAHVAKGWARVVARLAATIEAEVAAADREARP